MICSQCGKEFEGNFCPECGTSAALSRSYEDQRPLSEQNSVELTEENRTYYSPDLDEPVVSSQDDRFYGDPDLDTAPYTQQTDGLIPPDSRVYGTPQNKKSNKGCLIAAIVVGALLILLLVIGVIFGVNLIRSQTDWVNSAPSSGNSIASSSKPSKGNGSVEAAGELMTEKEIDQLYDHAADFKGRPIVITGKVFVDPERDEEGVYFQMFHDVEEYDDNTLIGYFNPDFQLKQNDYVRVTGIVLDEYVGENISGAPLKMPKIEATSVEIISYQEAVAPTKQELKVGQTKTQNGYSITVDKIEFADDETRVYFTVNNSGAANFHFYSFNTKIIQNNKQYEEEPNYAADYVEIQSDLKPGATSGGVVVFDDIPVGNMTIYVDAYSDNYQEDFSDYVFEITVK